MIKKQRENGPFLMGVAAALAMAASLGTTQTALADGCIDQAVAMIDSLGSKIDGLEAISNGLRNGLSKKLREARKVLTDGNPNNEHVALRKLGDFKDQVEGAVPKKLDAGDAHTLLDGADAVVAKLAECGVG